MSIFVRRKPSPGQRFALDILKPKTCNWPLGKHKGIILSFLRLNIDYLYSLTRKMAHLYLISLSDILQFTGCVCFNGWLKNEGPFLPQSPKAWIIYYKGCKWICHARLAMLCHNGTILTGYRIIDRYTNSACCQKDYR